MPKQLILACWACSISLGTFGWTPSGRQGMLLVWWSRSTRVLPSPSFDPTCFQRVAITISLFSLCSYRWSHLGTAVNTSCNAVHANDTIDWPIILRLYHLMSCRCGSAQSTFDARVTTLFPRYTTTMTFNDWHVVYTQKLNEEPSQVKCISAGKFLGGSAEL